MSFPARARTRLRDGWRALRRPEVQTDVVQVLKVTLATVVAWVVAVDVLELRQAFLAPWTALLTVHATIYRTLWRGLQSVIATAIGIVLSFLAVELLGYGALSLGAAVLVGLVLARTRVVREEGVAVATTAVFVITAGHGDQETLLLERFLDTLVGVATGMLVNVLVRPPLDDRVAEGAIDRATDELGELLRQMAEEINVGADSETVQGWVRRTREIDADLDRAESQLSFTQESQWANPRRSRSRHTLDVDSASDLLVRLEEGMAQTRTVARVVDESVVRAQEWDVQFRHRWTGLLERLGRCIEQRDLDVAPLEEEVHALVDDLSGDDLPHRHWPIYGALITAVVNLLHVVDEVAAGRSRLRSE